MIILNAGNSPIRVKGKLLNPGSVTSINVVYHDLIKYIDIQGLKFFYEREFEITYYRRLTGGKDITSYSGYLKSKKITKSDVVTDKVIEKLSKATIEDSKIIEEIITESVPEVKDEVDLPKTSPIVIEEVKSPEPVAENKPRRGRRSKNKMTELEMAKLESEQMDKEFERQESEIEQMS